MIYCDPASEQLWADMGPTVSVVNQNKKWSFSEPLYPSFPYMELNHWMSLTLMKFFCNVRRRIFLRCPQQCSVLVLWMLDNNFLLASFAFFFSFLSFTKNNVTMRCHLIAPACNSFSKPSTNFRSIESTELSLLRFCFSSFVDPPHIRFLFHVPDNKETLFTHFRFIRQILAILKV